MNIPILRDDATRMLLGRAMIMWLLVRLMFLAIAGAGGEVKAVPHPVGVILLAALLSTAEWRRKRELAFWRNLGVGLRRMIAIAITAAVAGELILSIGLRYVVSHG
jgi:hypothetical protein